MLASGALFLIAGLGCTPLLGGTQQRSMTTAAPNDSLAADIGQLFRAMMKGTYLPRIGAIALLGTVTVTLVDLLFKGSIAANVDPENLGTAFGAVYFTLNLLSLLTQIFLVQWLLRTQEVGRLLSILPGLLMLGGIGIAAGLGFVAALAAKTVDGALRHTLGRATMELLYVPLGTEMRGRVKTFIEVVGQRGGQALASFVFLAIASLTQDLRVVGLAAAACAAAWLGIAFSLRTPYIQLFHRRVDESGLTSRLAHAELDHAPLETLFARLSSPDDTEVLAALEILAVKGRTRLIPNLVLYHPSPQVVTRALELFRQPDQKVATTPVPLCRVCSPPILS